MIYLDNAATTGKKPETVIKAVNNALYKLSANPGRSGHKISINAASAVYNSRQKTSDFFSSSGPENVVFTANCTESLNFVIKGLLERGDKCVTSDIEHNAVMRPLFSLGADFKIAAVTENEDETYENFKNIITEDTKLVICTAGSNVLGLKPPIKRIGLLCKEMGIPFAVDAAQGAGVIPINMKEYGIDYLCIAAHKGLYAPMGVGVLIADKPIKKTIIEGGTGTMSESLIQPDMMPEKFESGTVNTPAIAAISAGIDFISKKGINNIYKHEMQLCKTLYFALKNNPDVLLYTNSFNGNNYLPVISFNVKNLTSMETAAYLDGKGIAVRAGLHCAPSAHKKIGTLDIGTVRVSPSVFTTRNEIEYLIKAVNEIKYKKY